MMVIGGFLGSGKTTLLNRMIRENEGERLAVLVNDFGDLAIDEQLIVEHGGDTIALANGCICCSIGNDLIVTLLRLLKQDPQPDRIVIEASGVADPRPIADMAELHKGLERGGTIVVVDAEQVLDLVGDPKLTDTIERQVVSADLIALNKCDLASKEAQDAVRSWIERVAPKVTTVPCVTAQIPTRALLGEMDFRIPSQDDGRHDDHGRIFNTTTLKLRSPVRETWLRERLDVLPKSIWRVKGFVPCDVSSGAMLLVQRVGRRTKLTPVDIHQIDGDVGTMVFIGAQDMPSQSWLASHFTETP